MSDDETERWEMLMDDTMMEFKDSLRRPTAEMKAAGGNAVRLSGVGLLDADRGEIELIACDIYRAMIDEALK